MTFDHAKYQPQDPDFKEKVKASFERQGFMQSIKAVLKEVAPGYCEIQVPFDKALSQQHGFFHAGVVSTVADTTAGYAAFSLMHANSSVLTVEYKINLMAPADGDYILGKAEVIKYGRTLSICNSKVYVANGDQLKLCAMAQVTLIELRNRKDA